MIDTLLAFRMPGAWEWLTILIFLVIPIVVAIIFIRFLLRNKKENIRLRLEVGKLADELEKVRKEKESKGVDSQTQL